MTTAPYREDWTLYRGTDQDVFKIRRHVESEPIIPTAAKAQVRARYGGALWLELDIDIDPEEGWVTVSTAEEDTESSEWDTRQEGVWDLEVTVDGAKSRWAQGRVSVSQDVTK
jgi:hypothetical protein